MCWKDISLQRCVWHIEDTKNGESHNVPLTDEAIQILKRRKANAESIFVFPGNGKAGHLADPKKAWKRILSHAEIEDLRIHDLRRTLGSWQAGLGYLQP